jgi:hypothetical protein
VIYLAVALGGALGALARFGVGNWVIGLGSGHLHMATFSVNVLGSLFIGLVFVGAERLNLPEAARLGYIGRFFGRLYNVFGVFPGATRGSSRRAGRSSCTVCLTHRISVPDKLLGGCGVGEIDLRLKFIWR